MHQGQPTFRGEAHRIRQGFIEGASFEMHLGTEHPRLFHLGVGRRAGHHDAGGNIEPGTVACERLRVIPRRHGDHPAPPFLVAEHEQAVERAAFLERSRELMVLELQVDIRTGDLRERRGTGARRTCHPACNPFPGSLNVEQFHRASILDPRHAPSGRQVRQMQLKFNRLLSIGHHRRGPAPAAPAAMCGAAGTGSGSTT